MYHVNKHEIKLYKKLFHDNHFLKVAVTNLLYNINISNYNGDKTLFGIIVITAKMQCSLIVANPSVNRFWQHALIEQVIVQI